MGKASGPYKDVTNDCWRVKYPDGDHVRTRTFKDEADARAFLAECNGDTPAADATSGWATLYQMDEVVTGDGEWFEQSATWLAAAIWECTRLGNDAALDRLCKAARAFNALAATAKAARAEP